MTINKKITEEKEIILDLFGFQGQEHSESIKPLPEKMRPKKLEFFIGQEKVTGKSTLIRNAIEQDKIFSMILWGPPGCGKTTLAGIIANETSLNFIQISAVLSGVKQIRSVIDNAKEHLSLYKKKTILFVDEIHRFNKSQQDAFLKHVESGLITLIGATTENPSFEVIPALISRCRVIILNSLSDSDMEKVLNRAVHDKENGLGELEFEFEKDALAHIVNISDGDVRTALNNLEMTAFQIKTDQKKTGKAIFKISLLDVERVLQKKALLYDKSGEEHYNIISAFHKSLRGSDPDAAVYWLLRMLISGEDPYYILRRMVRFASEDIGIADCHALTVALNAMESFKFIGYPEGELAIVQAAVYLATAPKSNSIYATYKNVKLEIENSGHLKVPLHIRNASTDLMKNLGYGKGYKYSHEYKGAYTYQEYLPEKLQEKIFYHPTDRGYEKIVKQRLDGWKQLKKKNKK